MSKETKDSETKKDKIEITDLWTEEEKALLKSMGLPTDKQLDCPDPDDEFIYILDEYEDLWY